MRVGDAANVPDMAQSFVGSLKERVERITSGLSEIDFRPRVFCVDWLEPLRNTGQWTPELVELSGGIEGLADKWGISREVSWSEVLEYDPDYIMVMPCAFDMSRTVVEVKDHMSRHNVWNQLRCVDQGGVILFDGQIPSRHGPRVVDVLEGLAEALHPNLFEGLAPKGVFARLEN